MKKGLLLAGALILVAVGAFAVEPKTYRVTGPIVEVTDAMIVVKKGKGNMQLVRDANTKVTGDLQVGSKVMMEYTRTATSIEVKESKKKSKSK